jgi:hypothetical protein
MASKAGAPARAVKWGLAADGKKGSAGDDQIPSLIFLRNFAAAYSCPNGSTQQTPHCTNASAADDVDAVCYAPLQQEMGASTLPTHQELQEMRSKLEEKEAELHALTDQLQQRELLQQPSQDALSAHNATEEVSCSLGFLWCMTPSHYFA